MFIEDCGISFALSVERLVHAFIKRSITSMGRGMQTSFYLFSAAAQFWTSVIGTGLVRLTETAARMRWPSAEIS